MNTIRKENIATKFHAAVSPEYYPRNLTRLYTNLYMFNSTWIYKHWQDWQPHVHSGSRPWSPTPCGLGLCLHWSEDCPLGLLSHQPCSVGMSVLLSMQSQVAAFHRGVGKTTRQLLYNINSILAQKEDLQVRNLESTKAIFPDTLSGGYEATLS